MRGAVAAISRGAVAGVVAALLIASPAWAVTITGRVMKGTERAPVKGVPVSIHVVRGNEELPGTTVNSDASGGFQFNGLTAGAGIEYYLSTEYEGAFYTEGPVAVQGGTATQDMTVYDVGKNFDAVKVQDHHVIVEKQDDGLHVTEIIIFQNEANTAYLGVGLNHAMESGMRVGLPSSVKDFQPGLGLDEPSVHLQGRELMSMRPIPPGQRPLSFTYVVPLSGRMDLSHRLYFPTRQITVLLSDPKLHLESNQLVSDGSRQQGGKTYAMYVGHDLPVGAEVEAKVGGAGFFSNPKVYPFMAAPFAILAVLWWASRRGTKQLKVKHGAGGVAGAHPAGK
ncbi:MAG: carboxypeptidase-like regulatory domain-containing protein, partial [Bacteroidota bacterium]